MDQPSPKPIEDAPRDVPILGWIPAARTLPRHDGYWTTLQWYSLPPRLEDVDEDDSGWGDVHGEAHYPTHYLPNPPRPETTS